MKVADIIRLGPVLSCPTRFQILRAALSNQSFGIRQLAKVQGVSPQASVKHLNKLESAGLIQTEVRDQKRVVTPTPLAMELVQGSGSTEGTYQSIQVADLCQAGVALSSPTRLRLLKLVRENPVVAYRLARAMELSYSTVVDHLKRLEAAGLITPLPRGKGKVYQPTPLCNQIDFGDGVTPWTLRGRTS